MPGGIRKAAWVTVIALAVLSPQPAFAAPTCKNFTVTNVAFGIYDPISVAPLDSVGSVSFTCPRSLSVTITVSSGTSGSFAPRSMAGPGTDRLQYNLYLDAAHTTVFGDGTNGTSTLSPANGVTSVSIYGRVFANQDVSAGAYTDTVVVTFWY